jgi:SAM-dependent methyltransferase
MGTPPPRTVTDVDAAFWIFLWRAPFEPERREAEATVHALGSIDAVISRLLSSAEFRLLLTAVRDGGDPDRRLRDVEETLRALGDEPAFIALAYRWILGREADSRGIEHYRNELAAGRSRLWLVRALWLSDEFGHRYHVLAPLAGFVPRDEQLCELANPAKWDNPDWVALLRSLTGVRPDKLSMHRKAYEFTQLLFGLERLGCLQADSRILSVGAGHEPVLYWLANRVGRVHATDRYEGAWQSEGAREGDRLVLTEPAHFAPFPYRQNRLVFSVMDGRRLAFAARTFDIAYSLSSIEHFGGVDAAREAVGEMARVLRPGGTLVLATEYLLAGRHHDEAFQPAEIRTIIDHPALGLVEPIDERVWQRYRGVPVDLARNEHQTPHMVVADRGCVFTSVMLFLRKAEG